MLMFLASYYSNKVLIIPTKEKPFVSNSRVQNHNSKLLCKKTVFLGQSCNTIIGFTHSPDSATDGIHLRAIWYQTASFWVNISNVYLNWSMILSVDDSVASRAKNLIRNHITIKCQQHVEQRCLTICVVCTSQRIHQRRFPFCYLQVRSKL